MYQFLIQAAHELLFLVGYVNNTGSFPEPLNPADEERYLALCANGDEAARSKLIEHNLRLVAHIAKKYATTTRETDDLISIGTIGLIKAVSTFNDKKGTALATYAARCIENEILMSIRAEKKSANDLSLNDPVGTDRDGNEISIGETLGSDPDSVQSKVELSLAAEQLRKAMTNSLTERERIVLELRYGLLGNKNMPQREIASLLGISRSYVSRIESKAISKLKRALDSHIV